MSEAVVVQIDMSAGKFIFIDVYKVHEDYPLEISIFGWIDMLLNATNLRVAHKFQTKLTRKNLRGVELRCALVVCSPTTLIMSACNYIETNIIV